jgi:membrane-associated protease RseP (regulator of RpoE activity)
VQRDSDLGAWVNWPPAAPPPVRQPPRRLWLHVLLFVLTAFTTTALGSRLAYNFRHNLPPFDLERDAFVFLEVMREPSQLLSGLPYSVTLLTILLAHELGHYLASVFYRVQASLPYFLPAPTLIGTFGAFIRFRSALRSRKELFDIGIAGPLAGFVFVLPALGIGLALSKVVPGIGQRGEMEFGTPLLMRAVEMWLFPGAPASDIALHPVARAAWVGLLATALNLLPLGQLDGGHLVYAVFGEKHKWISIGAILGLIPLGFMGWPWWWLWALVFWFIGRKHFTVYDDAGVGKVRRGLLALAAAIFVLSFIAVPVQYNSGQGLTP